MTRFELDLQWGSHYSNSSVPFEILLRPRIVSIAKWYQHGKIAIIYIITTSPLSSPSKCYLTENPHLKQIISLFYFYQSIHISYASLIQLSVSRRVGGEGGGGLLYFVNKRPVLAPSLT